MRQVSPCVGRVRSGVLAAVVCAMVWAAVAAPVAACPYSIRDTGFSSWNREAYYVFLFLPDDGPKSKALGERFEKVAETVLYESNVLPKVVDAKDRGKHKAAPHLDDLGIKTLPAAILVSSDNRALPLPGIGAGATEEAIRKSLEGIIASPATEDLAAHCIENWCIVLLIPGADPKETARVKALVKKANDDIVGATTELGRTIDAGAHVIEVSAKDPKEHTFLWSLDLAAEQKAVRVVVLHGHGQQFGPVLQGTGITEDMLSMLFHTLGRSCACTMHPALLAGPTIPMAWTEAQRMEVADIYGFDPDSPRFRRTVQRYIPRRQQADMVRHILGYSEQVVELSDKPPAEPGVGTAADDVAVDAIEQAPIAAIETKEPTIQERASRSILLAVGGLVILVALAAGILFLRRMRVS